ncbi:MAG: GGDEF domain-containing protein, partial [Acidobacteria bacterium]|nr:GGDEF domain-containing protein [Acidobacteriota bacterium]
MASDDLRAARANSRTNLTSSEPDRVALPRPEEEGLDPFRRLEKRDWELWSIALILFTVFAGGIVTFAYISARGDPAASPGVLRWVWLLLFGLVALVLLLNVYLIDKKRTLSRLWRRTLAQEIELENQRLQAGTDSLTQVHNRRFFDDVGPKEVRRAVRANRPLSVLLVDIDHFREVNAQLGHFAGDEVLRLVADTLKNA